MAPACKKRKNAKTSRGTKRQAVVKRKDVLIALEEHHNKECMFCGKKEISERSYGLLYQFNDVVVHYFCILLSSRAIQNGEDKDGILGFLIKDIKTELNRGSRETCVYCKKNGATISCCEPRCRKIFHLPCGMENGSMHQFYQKFKSFCAQHRMTQAVDIAELQNNAPVECSICKQNVLPTPLPDSIWAPCCRRNAWFHRKCIQDLALSTGYFFKCPLCNNVEKFKSRMLYLGIYIPSRDASWETVPNAFAELLERHNSCDATTCLCPHRDKRKFQQESGSWEIILCCTCGSSGTHKLCSSIKVDQEWSCKECLELTERAKKRQLETSNGNGSMTHEQRLSQNATSSNSVAIGEVPRSRRICDSPRNVAQRNRRNREAIARNAAANETIVMGRNREAITRNGAANETIVSGRNRESPKNMDIVCVPSTSNGNRTVTRNVGLRELTRNSGSFHSNRNIQSAVSTRESPRLNNTNKEINYQNYPSTSSSTPIYISDDNSNDSDVLIVTYVEPPKLIPKELPSTLEYQLQYSPVVNDPNYPRICNVGTLGEVAGRIAPRRFIANQFRDRGSHCVVTDNIDLTSDDNDANDNNNNLP